MKAADIVRGLVSQRPLTRAELVAISGLKSCTVRSVTNDLVRVGMLVMDGDRYAPGRAKIVRPPRTREKERARCERHRRKKGERPRAEYLAALAARKAARLAAKAALKAARAEARRNGVQVRREAVSAERAIWREERRQRASGALRQRNIDRAAQRRAELLARLESQPSIQVVEPVRLMTSEEWLAMGNKVQRLEPWEVSNPLKSTQEIVRRMAA